MFESKQSTHARLLPVTDTGLLALVWAAKRLGRVADAVQLRHRLGRKAGTADWVDLCRCAKWSGLRARSIQARVQRLQHLPLPALLETTEGWLVLLEVKDQQVRLRWSSPEAERTLSVRELRGIWSGQVLLLAEQSCVASSPRFGASWFLPSILKHARQLRGVLAASFILQLIALVTPMLFENIIDRVLVSRGLSSLQILGLALVGLALFEPIFGLLRAWLFCNLASKVNAELSGRLFQHLLRLPLNYFRQRSTGEIVARFAEMQSVRQFLTGSALTLVLDLIFCSMFIAVMYSYAPTLTVIVVVSLMLYLLFWLCVGPLLRRQVLREYEQDAASTAFLTETVSGIETVKTGASDGSFEQQWQRQLASQVRAAFASRRTGIWAAQGIGLIQKLSAALILWWGVGLVMDGKLTPGQLVAFNMLAAHVVEPILRLAQVWQDFQHTLVALARLGDIVDRQSEQGSGGLVSVPQLQGRVSLQGVRFRYTEDGPEVLRNLCLDIEPGSFIGITGPSGSGKSTLTRLLQRLYVPQHGRVLVDGIDLAVADPVALRCNMSVVLQESELFTGSIADNIRLCRPQASDAQVREAAQLAGAAEFIDALAQGYATEVGERGGQLSGGQRQRVALARALLASPGILILDEATSALDYESEAAIIANLGLIAQGRTVISIAHRLNTLRHAHRILVIDQGQVVEQGTHEQLLAQDGFYARQWALQTKVEVTSLTPV